MYYQKHNTSLQKRKEANTVLDITLRQLESFAATVEYRSFTRAAESLYLTQSTVSAHIAALEETLGIPLLLRGARRQLTLTPEGRQVYTAALDILARCSALRTLSVSAGDEPMLIGASTVPAQYLLPELLRGFLHDQPDIHYQLRRGDSQSIHHLLEQGEIHVGFVGAALDRKRFSYHTVAEDRLLLVTSNEERFREARQRGTDAFELLLQEPFLSREPGSGTAQALEKHLASHGIAPESLRIAAHIESPEVLKNAVMQGLGVAVLSELAVRQEAADGRLLIFEPREAITRRIYMAVPRNGALHPAERSFVNFVRESRKKDYHR